MSAKPRKPPARVAMDYIHYLPWLERGDDESHRRRKSLEHALMEFGFVVGQLRRITDRLKGVGKEDITEETVSWFVQDIGYHGEYFLNTAYEIQDRMAGLLAEVSRCPKDQLIGRLNAYKDARMPRYLRLKETMPAAAKQFLALESCICSFVRLRRLNTELRCTLCSWWTGILATRRRFWDACRVRHSLESGSKSCARRRAGSSPGMRTRVKRLRVAGTSLIRRFGKPRNWTPDCGVSQISLALLAG